jgi:hypothetical protein
MPHFATTSEKAPHQNVTSFAPLHGLLQRKCACGGTTGPTGECDQCRKKRESKTDHSFESPPIVHEVLNSPGQQLDSATRALMEPRFGHDFGSVRVHTDAKAAESARAVGALAYTVGHNVVFGENKFAPATLAGRKLLGHELAHTIQQGSSSSAGAFSPYQPIRIDPPGTSLEQAAEEHSSQLECRVGMAAPSHRIALQRQPAPQGEIEMPTEWAFAADKRKRRWRHYAQSLAKEDASRIRKKGKLTLEDRAEINAKLDFFEGDAKQAYIREIRPALVTVRPAPAEIPREEIEMPEERVGTISTPTAAPPKPAASNPPVRQSSPGKQCKFYVYDSTEPTGMAWKWKVAAFALASARPGAYVIPSGDSIEEALKGIFDTYAVKDCGCTDEVQFFSHGSPANAWSITKTNDELTIKDFNIPGLDQFGDGPTSMPGYREWHDKLSVRQRRLVLLRRTICGPDAEIYYRSCEAFQGKEGQEFAKASTEFWRSNVVGHTKVIALTQPGKKELKPGQEPYWSESEGTGEPSPKKPIGVGAEQKPKKD